MLTEPHLDFPDLAALNKDLAKSLRTLHKPELDYQAQRIESCVHSLTRPDDEAKYCGSKLCLECRRWRAVDERRVLKGLLDIAISLAPSPMMYFQTLTLQDCVPAEVGARAAALVSGFAKLRRKLPFHVGWMRVIETKTSDLSPESENVHFHFVMLFPAGQADGVRSVDWNALWTQCAGGLARDTDPNADFARVPDDVICYMTKGFDWDYEQDGHVGVENPWRYVHRVENGHAKFSSGGLLRLRLFAKMEKQTGLHQISPRSTARRRARRPDRVVFPPIPVEGK